MNGSSLMTPTRVRLLDEDRGLASVLSPEELNTARRYAVAECFELERGPYRPGSLVDPEGLLGLLVLEGLMVRQVIVAERRCGELVGRRAILRPWDDFGKNAPLPFEIKWRVVEPTRVAVLDRRFLATIVRWPTLIEAVMDRMVERAHTLAFNVAIHCLKHVELRLLVLFWHLADRFGKVTPEGINIPVPLAHSDLGELVGAARPSVSTALKELGAKGQLWRNEADRTWMLSMEPPEELRDMRRQQHLAAEAPLDA
jgi:CRP/FNR family transcriptional regulator, cyclic AMP receptor protein